MPSDGHLSADLSSPPTWRPWPLRTSFLTVLSVLSLILCLSIEVIIRGCSTSGCHVFGAMSTSHLSPESNFVYNLLPTIISVCFSLLWITVHHDVLRLEPYFQMSTPGGALAEDSILLDYPYKFPLLVPFLALKRRHYVVFLSTCILLLINFFVVPLTSGIFDDARLLKSFTSTATLGVIKPADENVRQFSPNFTYVAYDYQWLDRPLPPFTTPKYAVLPVKPAENMLTGNETWTAETTLFEAELSCEAAKITTFESSRSDLTGLNITSTLLDGYSCLMWDMASKGNPLEKVLLGCSSMAEGWTEPRMNTYDTMEFLTPWASTSCGGNGERSEVTLHIWGSAADPESESNLPANMTAIFCTPSYYSQTVSATFTVAGEIINVNRTGIRKPFTGARGFGPLFNGSSTGMTEAPPQYMDSDNNMVGLGFRPELLPNVDSQLRRRFNNSDISSEMDGKAYYGDSSSSIYIPDVYTLTGYSLYTQQPETLGDLLDPQALAAMYQGAFQLLFAIALFVQMIDDEAFIPTTVVRDIDTVGFTVNNLWARGAQIGFAVLAMMIVAFAILNHRRRCEVDGEPNSMAAALQLLAASPEMCAQMKNAEFHDENDLRDMLVLSGGRYELVYSPRKGPMVQVVGLDTQREELIYKSDPWTDATFWILKSTTGIGILTTFGAIAALLIAIASYSNRHNGLPVIGGANSFEYKLVFSFIPLVIGMSIEPLLVSIGSCYCMLGPYESLRRSQSRSRHTLGIDYDKCPPHFQLFGSLRVGNIGLASLASAILLANVLTVALAGLFSISNSDFGVTSDIGTYQIPTIKKLLSNYDWDIYYTLAANVSDAIDLPTWIKNDLYVVPFEPLDQQTDIYSYQGPTIGIGADINCTMIQAQNISLSCIDTEVINSCDWMDLRPLIHDPCYDPTDEDSNLLYLQYWPSKDLIAHSTECPGAFIAAWVQKPANPYPNDPQSPDPSDYEAVFLSCTSREMAYDITATVNEAKQVLATTDIRPLNTEAVAQLYSAGISYPGNLTSAFIEALTMTTDTETIASSEISWVNYFMAYFEPEVIQHATNITHIPNVTVLKSTFEDVFRRLFAIKLRLNAEEIFSPGEYYVAPGTAFIKKDRVSVSSSMSVLIAIIILYNIAVLLVLYGYQRPQISGHIPISLAGMYAHLYSSNVKADCGIGKTPEERAGNLKGDYRYGLFEGEDGKVHFGVYREISTGKNL